MSLKFTLIAALLGATSPSIHAQTLAQAHQASTKHFIQLDFKLER